jgi:hypothetical protein
VGGGGGSNGNSNNVKNIPEINRPTYDLDKELKKIEKTRNDKNGVMIETPEEKANWADI